MKRERPDYLFDYNASVELANMIRQYYARLERSPKVWVEETVIPYGGRDKRMFCVRSNITMRVPNA